MNLSFNEWLAYGVISGYCTEQFCVTHDTGPQHPSEEAEWERRNDPCCHAVRLGTMSDLFIGDWEDTNEQI